MLENMLESSMPALDRHPIHIGVLFEGALTVPHDLSKVQQHVPLKRGRRGGSTFSKARFQSLIQFLNSSGVHSRMFLHQPVPEDREGQSALFQGVSVTHLETFSPQ